MGQTLSSVLLSFLPSFLPCLLPCFLASFIPCLCSFLLASSGCLPRANTWMDARTVYTRKYFEMGGRPTLQTDTCMFQLEPWKLAKLLLCENQHGLREPSWSLCFWCTSEAAWLMPLASSPCTSLRGWARLGAGKLESCCRSCLLRVWNRGWHCTKAAAMWS